MASPSQASLLLQKQLKVYPDGKVCISILHPPGEDPNGYELASERAGGCPYGRPHMEEHVGVFAFVRADGRPDWEERVGGFCVHQGWWPPLPSTIVEALVESIVLSVISMLSSPNDESPANVEAAKDWRERREEFRKKVSRCVRKSQEML
ncbi:hypothetical protein C3L33_22881, partial [Rhododendron williamsianum]